MYWSVVFSSARSCRLIRSLELLIWGYFQPEAIQRYTRLWISATTHLLSLRYSLRKVLGAEAAGIQSLLQVAEEAVETYV